MQASLEKNRSQLCVLLVAVWDAETVTYILKGENQHMDSAGNHGVLKEGWVQVCFALRLPCGVGVADACCGHPFTLWRACLYRAVQWMTAGSGVVHSEMPGPKLQREGGTSEGFQLWVNLPAKDKWSPPRYQVSVPLWVVSVLVALCAPAYILCLLHTCTHLCAPTACTEYSRSPGTSRP